MRVGIIGFGGIGDTLLQAIGGLGTTERIEVTGVLVRPIRIHNLQSSEPNKRPYVTSIGALLDTCPDVVVECAGHAAVAQYGERVLSAGIDLIVISAGALANEELHETLVAAATANRATLYIPAGALVGIDGLTAARHAGISKVVYKGYKPPTAWHGTPAEGLVDLNSVQGEITVFVGNARDVALIYPKNSNVAAIVALAGIGFDRTNVELIVDANLSENQHFIEVQAETGNFQISVSGHALPDNPKTSALAAYSIVKCLFDRQSAIVF